jgi:hypothetical protein
MVTCMHVAFSIPGNSKEFPGFSTTSPGPHDSHTGWPGPIPVAGVGAGASVGKASVGAGVATTGGEAGTGEGVRDENGAEVGGGGSTKGAGIGAGEEGDESGGIVGRNNMKGT